MSAEGRRSEGAITLASGWLVVLLVLLAGQFVLRHAELEPGMELRWYALTG